MLSFKKPEISDKAWADKCFEHSHSMNCEYSFGTLFIWSTAYSTEICHFNDFIICRWGRGKDISYSLPIGEGNFTQAIEEIIEDAKALGVTPKIYGVTEGSLKMLQEAFTGKFDYKYDDGFNDYIYSVEKMASLRGKKYHSKRNHISNFKKNNPNWQFEKLTKENLAECIEIHTNWIKDREDSEDISEYSLEFEAVLTAFEYFDELGFVGGVIRVDGKIIAYTLGELHKNGKCFITHFEKAPADVQGAFAIINQEFTANCLMDYEYVNREEDLGLEGLRKAKQSYYPEIWLTKCLAVYNG